MISSSITIVNPTGLHTRPGQQFVTKAKEFECEITVKKEDKEANAKSLLKMLKLGISQNHTIELICDGVDETQAMSTLTKFISELTE